MIDDTVLSSEITEEHFVCDLTKCKGQCCIEGDMGAPLDKEELPILEEIYPKVKEYLSEEGRAAIEKQGTHVVDEDGDYCTPLIEDRECAYAIYDEKNTLKCGIEQAYLDGKISWKKPISCHLYPIRISKLEDYWALNYHRWDICADACSLGKSLQVPLFQFLKEPLIRRFGEKWFKELEQEYEDRKAME